MQNDLRVGEEAPNFDLTSTEDVVLMLRDEVPRTPVLLYFFSDAESEDTKTGLRAIAASSEPLAKAQIRVLAVSPAKLEALKGLQRELALGFPLLHDDRSFSASYGLTSADDKEPESRLVLVGRRQRILWVGGAGGDVATELSAAIEAARGVSSTTNYPRSVINRLVDFWVN